MNNQICIKVGAKISFRYTQIPVSVWNEIGGDLTLVNPKYISAEKYGRYTGNIKRNLLLYQVEEDNDIVILPRGYGQSLIGKLKANGIKYMISDNRLLLPEVNFTSMIKLRDYQVPAVEELLNHRQGGVVAGCGSGKTQILLEAMAKLKQPSLWICHTYELLDQTRERAIEFLHLEPEDIGEIANGKINIGNKLTFALIQTLCKADLKQVTEKFGAVFVDEAHHLPANSFFNTVGNFPAAYCYWASATPEREDGLTDMIFAAGGPILYEIDQRDLPTITPKLCIIETNFDDVNEDYSKLMESLINNGKRNDLIIKTIIKESPGNYSLVLSDRIEHIQALKARIDKELPVMRTEIITGKMSKAKRKKIMDSMKNKEIDILFATKLAKEGLDVHHLNRLFLTTPKRASSTIRQEAGRIMRPAPGKNEAIVYDFWDNKNPILRPQFWKRREGYRKLGITV